MILSRTPLNILRLNLFPSVILRLLPHVFNHSLPLTYMFQQHILFFNNCSFYILWFIFILFYSLINITCYYFSFFIFIKYYIGKNIYIYIVNYRLSMLRLLSIKFRSLSYIYFFVFCLKIFILADKNSVNIRRDS